MEDRLLDEVQRPALGSYMNWIRNATAHFFAVFALLQTVCIIVSSRFVAVSDADHTRVQLLAMLCAMVPSFVVLIIRPGLKRPSTSCLNDQLSVEWPVVYWPDGLSKVTSTTHLSNQTPFHHTSSNAPASWPGCPIWLQKEMSDWCLWS